MDDHELERRVGTVLRGKWTLERLLGSGGMAAVYVAVHKIGRRDAIKILHPEIARVGLGDVDDARLTKNIAIVVEANQLPRAPETREVFDRSFMPARADRPSTTAAP